MAAPPEHNGDGGGAGSGPSGEELTMLTGSNAVKVILLGDSAVGKSKLVERYLLDNYKPHQLSTYALTLYRHNYETADGSTVPVDIWDTAGQERFQSMHASYYHRACACIMVFDVTRKVTYKNLEKWYDELQDNCKGIPTIVVANKVDVDYKVSPPWVTSKSFNFAAKRKLPFFFVSASDGTNVVKIFRVAIMAGIKWKTAPKDDFYQDVLDLLGEVGLDDASKGKGDAAEDEDDETKAQS